MKHTQVGGWVMRYGEFICSSVADEEEVKLMIIVWTLIHVFAFVVFYGVLRFRMTQHIKRKNFQNGTTRVQE